jgi:hypothetical protein
MADNGMMVMGELHQGKVLACPDLVESETVFVGNLAGKGSFGERRLVVRYGSASADQTAPG